MAKKIKLDFSALTPAQQIDLVDKVIPACTNNGLLPGMSAPVTAATTAVYLFRILENKVDTTEAAWRTAVAERDGGQPAFVKGALTDLANAATVAAGGSDAALLSSQFPLTSGEKTPPSPLAKVINLSLTAGDLDGEVDAHWDSVKNKKNYLVQTTLTPAEAASWHGLGLPVSKSKTTFAGLTSGQKIWIRVCALGGSTGQGPWSDVASITVP